MWIHLTPVRKKLAYVSFALAVAGFAPAVAQQAIPAAGAAQIQALLREKANRTPAQNKLDSQIIYNSKRALGQSIAAGLSSSFTPAALQTSGDGLVHVDITANVTAGVLAAITSLGGRIESSFPQYKAIRAWLPLSSAETLAGRADVQFVKPAVLRLTNSGLQSVLPGLGARQANVLSQMSRSLPAFATQKSLPGGSATNVISDTSGVVAHGADIVQAAGITGTGIKIGVMSNGVTSLASEQAAGRLPAVTVIAGQGGTGPGPCPGNNCPDEGTAMLEIVYSMAPGAQLFFATADPSEAQFATNILALQAAGCNIIVDDVTYFAEPVFQDGTIAKAVNTVTAAGALYFSSAANSGNLDSNQSGTWEGDFNADGNPPGITETGTVHNFGGSDFDVLTAKGSVYLLQWSDPAGASCNDYDLFILNPAGTAVEAASTSTQSCTQDPFEGIGDSSAIAVNSRIVIINFNGGAARALHLDTERGRLSIGTAGNTFGHNAGANTLTVAAVDVATASGGIFVGGTTNPPEFFSSDGPRKIFYDPTGAAITPGNFLFGTNGGTTLAKVDFTAANGTPSGVPGFNPFFGTSAAAPHAAAIAGLIMSANNALTSTQVKNILYSTSLHVSNFLPRTVGTGIVMANLGVAAATTPDLTITKAHTGNFTQGQTGATYTITVTNSGAGPTSGTVTVVDTLPSGLTATAMAGTGWVCTVATVTCTTTTVEAGGASFPVITLTVSVSASAAASLTNSVAVSGGGETNGNNDTAMDPTTVNPSVGPAPVPDLTVAKSHTGDFAQGQVGATYTITVTNSGATSTTGTVTVVDTLPAGLTATAMTGTGWACTVATLTCTTTTVEGAGASFPAITLTVSVSGTAAANVTNVATVSGGGETNTTNDTAGDPTTIDPAAGNISIADAFQVRYAANLNIGDSDVDITNTGTSGGNLCANVYTFDPAEELIACCTCSVTPNGLQSLSVRNSLLSNTLTPAIPTSVVIKIVATNGTGACNASNISTAQLASGLRVWGTTIHGLPTSPVTYGVSETPFSNSVLSLTELAHITSFCGFIQADASGFGICKGCAAGGLGAAPAQ
jgi:uncharacterized repeat protein (TIGR01451 family)